jgi:23S rRNA (uracil1939-C5)-methyltransferase
MDRVVGQTAELTLDGIAHGGEALGRYGGKVIFVPYGIPGERVQVEIIEQKNHWARARLMSVLTSSPDRIDPPCPYFGPDRCGGCQWQHIAYERQAALKQEIVRDQLHRLGHISAPSIADIIALARSSPSGSDPPAESSGNSRESESQRVAEEEAGLLDFGYRNHTHFAVAANNRLGYRRGPSHDVIPVERCLLLHERLDELHSALDITWTDLSGISLRAGINTGQALVVFDAADDEQPELEVSLPTACALRTPRAIQPLVGEPCLEEAIHGRRYRISAESFFQINTVGAEALVDVVRSYVDLRPADVLLDAYCGVGLFALALAGSVAHVIGIESSAAACEDFAFNAGNRQNVSLHEGTVEDVLPALRTQYPSVDVVVMDPPRAGTGPQVIRELAALKPRRIVYVSCDPATLARDSLHLSTANYHLVEVQPVDLFPQTCHVETVSLWERNGQYVNLPSHRAV